MKKYSFTFAQRLALDFWLLLYAAIHVIFQVPIHWLSNVNPNSRSSFAAAMNISITTKLHIPPTVAWNTLLQRDTFLYITRGIMRYGDSVSWPETLMKEGLEIHTIAYPLSILPGAAHTFKIVEVDGVSLVIRTKEQGGIIQQWNHTMTVKPLGNSSCYYTDQVEIRAGFLTFPIWLFANVFYRIRQSRWRTLASKLGDNA